MKTTLLLGLCLIVVTSCSKNENPGSLKKLEHASFIHLLYPSEAACNAAQTDPDFFVNCHQQLDFVNDHEVQLMLSDILWSGTFKVEGKEVVLTFENSYEIPEREIRFKVLSASKLMNLNDGIVWNKMKGKSIWH